MPIPQFTVIPNSLTAPEVFASAMDTLLGEFPAVISAMNALEVAGTLSEVQDVSTSSVAIGTGAKTFTVTAGKSFVAGMWLLIADAAAPGTNWMLGQITSYAGTTLIVNVTVIAGSGTLASWVISQAVAASSSETITLLESTAIPPCAVLVHNTLTATYDNFTYTLEEFFNLTADSVYLRFNGGTAGTTYVGENVSINSGSVVGDPTKFGRVGYAGLALNDLAGTYGVSKDHSITMKVRFTNVHGTGVKKFEGEADVINMTLTGNLVTHATFGGAWTQTADLTALDLTSITHKMGGGTVRLTAEKRTV